MSGSGETTQGRAATAARPDERATAAPANASTDADATSADATGAADDAAADRATPGGRRVMVAAYALAVLPFLVAAVAMVATVGGDYHPAGDLAMTEMHVRDIGHHEVLVGLYSRNTWSHPGPLQFYLVAPFYWLTGGSSIGLVLGALALNGATVAGMVAVARRRGGTPVALCTVVVSGLLVRTLGTEFLGDSWNLTLTVLPLALLVLLTWSLLAGDVVMLPVAAVVTTFLVQTHVGFAVIAAPLFALAAGVMAVRALRGPERRDFVRVALLTGAALVVLWLPPLVDAVVHQGSNTGDMVRYFRDPGEPTNSLRDGWRVVSGQFGSEPEWLTGKLGANPLSGESPFVTGAPAPVLLAVLAAAGVVLWRRSAEGRALVVAIGAVLVTCIASVMRTAGPVYDYRLRYTWAPPAVAAIAVCWAAWLVVTRRWPRLEARLLVPGFLAVGALVTAVNVVEGVRADAPHQANTEIVDTITAPVVEAYRDADDPLVVYEPQSPGIPWYSRGLVLQLERRGIDVRVAPELGPWFTEARTYRGGPVEDRLVVALDLDIAPLLDDPDLRLLARWSSVPDAVRSRIERDQRELADQWSAGELSPTDRALRFLELQEELTVEGVSADQVAIFVDNRRT